MPTLELVYDTECPNVEAARAQLRGALERVGFEQRWNEWRIGDPDSPAHVHGYGSPTILVNGKDVAGVNPNADACCRIYRGSDGSLARAPTVDEIVQAIRAAPDAVQRGGAWASGAAIASAVLSSACCWLPLLLVAVGATAGSVASFFEAYRPYLIGSSAVFLGTGFYYAYLRKPSCAPGEACAAPNPRVRRASRMILWIAAGLVAAFALFPNYVGFLLGGGPEPMHAAAVTHRPMLFAIEGMTCAGCASHVQSELAKVGGVARAEVSYEEKVARIYPKPDSTVDRSVVLAAIESAGYRGRALEAEEKRIDP